MTIPDESSTIILDIGAHSCKVGLSTDLNPHTIRTLIGQIRDRNSLNGSGAVDTYFGEEAARRRGILSFKYPGENGVLQDLNSIEAILRYAFDKVLYIDTSERSILITVPAKSHHEYKQEIGRIFFENFGVKYVSFCFQSQLSILPFAISTGCVIDLGETKITISPVYLNEAMDGNSKNFAIGGKNIAEQLRENLIDHPSLHDVLCSRNCRENLHDMVEKCGCVRVCADDEVDCVSYETPENQTVIIKNERTECAEILFRPDYEYEGLHYETKKVIMSCDNRIIKYLFSNILLVGGTSKIEGLRERLENELKAIVMAFEVNVRTCEHPDLAAWHGGKIFASKPEFSSTLLDRESFEMFMK